MRPLVAVEGSGTGAAIVEVTEAISFELPR